ncbi:hypothetical protein CEXT_212561 [Caerostris extrusa]|uniref:Uncharacterized protein n=1 Tax=Caerostris extrusa TaxID=172846 RepID=A0AAV4WVM4_CAEEX|nr:hypothetical protein CEXT_212561 [Caerostris extrusa]
MASPPQLSLSPAFSRNSFRTYNGRSSEGEDFTLLREEPPTLETQSSIDRQFHCPIRWKLVQWVHPLFSHLISRSLLFLSDSSSQRRQLLKVFGALSGLL